MDSYAVSIVQEMTESLCGGSICEKPRSCVQNESKETQHILGNPQCPGKDWAWLQPLGHPYAVSCPATVFLSGTHGPGQLLALQTRSAEDRHWGQRVEGLLTLLTPQGSGTLQPQWIQTSFSLVKLGSPQSRCLYSGTNCSEFGISWVHGGTAGPY